MADTSPEVVSKKEELLSTVAELKRRTEDAGGRLSAVEECAKELSAKYRELRNTDTKAQSYTPAGSDREAYERYTLEPSVVKAQCIDVGNREEIDGLRYGNYEKGTKYGQEFVVSKNAGHAIRMLSEWDQMGFRDPGLLDDPEPATEWQLRLQQMAEARTMRRLFGATYDSRGNRRPGETPEIDATIRRHIQRGPIWIKQVFADNSGEGAEFIPDVVLPELGRRLEMPRNVIGLFQTMQIPTGGATLNPFLTAGCQPFIVGVPASGDLDPADIQRSVPSTTSLTGSPVTWGVSLPASRDATEDSIIEWGSFANMLLAEGIRDGEEDAAINADTNGGDTGLASWNIRGRWNTLGHNGDHRKSFVGLRNYSIDTSGHSALSTESAVGIIAELAILDSPLFVDDLALITSPEFVLLKLLTDTNLLTVDKYGSLATLLTGEVGRIAGHPVVMSEFVDVQYNASGVYDNTTKTKTGVLAVARRRWAKGIRRGPRVEVETRPSQHMTLVVVTERWTLRNLGRTTEKSVGWFYNATAS